jgi:hypothetical protein
VENKPITTIVVIGFPAFRYASSPRRRRPGSSGSKLSAPCCQKGQQTVKAQLRTTTLPLFRLTCDNNLPCGQRRVFNPVRCYGPVVIGHADVSQIALKSRVAVGMMLALLTSPCHNDCPAVQVHGMVFVVYPAEFHHIGTCVGIDAVRHCRLRPEELASG